MSIYYLLETLTSIGIEDCLFAPEHAKRMPQTFRPFDQV